MGKSQRLKGHTFERWVARELREKGFDAKRGLQSRDGDDAPDVVLPGFWIECKRGRKPNVRAALRQAIEASDGEGLVAAVIRDDRAAPFVAMPWLDWLDLIGGGTDVGFDAED